MNKKICILCVAMLFCWGVAAHAQQQQQDQVRPVLASPNGRFVFGQISAFARHQYMLDTQTGRLWVLIEKQDGEIMLQAVPYKMLNGKSSLDAPEAEYEIKALAEEAAKAKIPPAIRKP